MTRERAKELLPIITAFSEGKTIQFNYPGDGSGWRDVGDDTQFSYGPECYRIKPEPREWIANVNSDGSGSIHVSQHYADIYMKEMTPGCKQIRVREILEP